jgi:carotenoid cleavage dioxygenase
MMHDFALSAEHIIFMDPPVVFRLDIARSGSRDMPYRWSDDYGARLGVLRRDDPFGRIRWFDIDPCYVFHVLNAFDKTTDDGELVVLQAARYSELWRDDGAHGSDAVMWSWPINLSRGSVSEEQIDERAVEFPRIDDHLVGIPARYRVTGGYGANSCATTWNAAPLRSMGSVRRPSLVARVRLYSLRPIQGQANSPAGICPMFTTRSGTAATW